MQEQESVQGIATRNAIKFIEREYAQLNNQIIKIENAVLCRRATADDKHNLPHLKRKHMTVKNMLGCFGAAI